MRSAGNVSLVSVKCPWMSRIANRSVLDSRIAVEKSEICLKFKIGDFSILPNEKLTVFARVFFRRDARDAAVFDRPKNWVSVPSV